MKDDSSIGKRVLFILVALGLIAGIGVGLRNQLRVTEKSDENLPSVERLLPKAGNDEVATVSDRDFVDYGSESATAEDDLELVESLLVAYFRSAKEDANRFPMGTNREITRVLAGHNPMRHGWIPSDHPAINDDGELIDRWNRPLHFHGLGAGVFEIRSAGPDTTLFTDDDILMGSEDS